MSVMVLLLFYVVSLLASFCRVNASPLPNNQRLCGPGNKVQLSETIFDTGSIDDYQFNFVSVDNQIVLIRTNDGTVYRSSDEGLTWSKLDVPAQMGGVSKIYYSEVITGYVTVYLLGQSMGIYSSKDGGENFTYYSTLPSGINGIKLHPSNPGIALATRVISRMPSELWLTKDYGATWDRILEMLPPGFPEWSKFSNTSPNRIYILDYANPASPVPLDYVIKYSDDYFVTSNTLAISHVNSMHIYEPNKFVVITCEDSACQQKELYASDDGGASFNLAKFPDVHQEVLDERDYYVWEISDDAIWTYVKRDCLPSNNNCWGDLFHSNAVDRDFALSLRYNQEYQFTKYNSLDGIYLANQFITKGEVPQANDLVRSLITFNKGSEWSIIQAPAKDANGQPYTCSVTDGCSLHLYGFRRDHAFTYFYSIPSAPGLMIATGNIGTRLEDKVGANTNTYASWDGGKNWKEVRKQSYVPEIGDYGGVIVMVREDGATNEIVYTVTDGDEWKPCIFSDTPFDIANIRINPKWDSKKFLMYGEKVINGTSKGVVIQLNFDNEFTGQCTDADFDTWSPTDVNGNCVMGLSKSYRKRKTGRNCFLGAGYVPLVSSTVCPCGPDDYECDHCFYRKELNSPCYLECDVSTIPEPPTTCNGTGSFYSANIGYRLVDNTSCSMVNAKPKPQSLLPCPASSTVTRLGSSGLGAIPIVIVVVVIILACIGGVYYFYKHNDTFHDFVTYTLGFDDDSTGLNTYQTVEQGQSLTDNAEER